MKKQFLFIILPFSNNDQVVCKVLVIKKKKRETFCRSENHARFCATKFVTVKILIINQSQKIIATKDIQHLIVFSTPIILCGAVSFFLLHLVLSFFSLLWLPRYIHLIIIDLISNNTCWLESNRIYKTSSYSYTYFMVLTSFTLFNNSYILLSEICNS